MDSTMRLLPSDVVQHIQSRMNAREAARMATLSKNLYASWCSRKHVEIDESHFRDIGRCWGYALDTLDRFEEDGMKIESFTVRVDSRITESHIIYEVVGHAERLGAENICVEVRNESSWFLLHDDVLGSESLKHLSLIGCNFYSDWSKSPQRFFTSLCVRKGLTNFIGNDMLSDVVMRTRTLKVLECDAVLFSWKMGMLGNVCHGLESLTLNDYYYEGADFFTEICNIFPSLKYLAVRGMYNCLAIRIYSDSLTNVSLSEHYRRVNVFLNVPNLQWIRFEGPAISRCKILVHSKYWESDLHIVCFNCSASWFVALRRLLKKFVGSKINLSVDVKYDQSNYICDYTMQENHDLPVVERLYLRTTEPCPGIVDGLYIVCRPLVFNLHAVSV